MIAPAPLPTFVVYLALLVLVVAALWLVLLRLGRLADPFRRLGYAKAAVAAKVAENERIALENRIRRHPDFVRLDLEHAPVFDHDVWSADGFVGEHRLNPACVECVGVMESCRG